MDSNIRCNKCKEDKPSTLEYFNKSNLNEKYHLCRKCKSEIDKQYRIENHSNILEKQRNHYKENKSKILDNQKTYNQGRKEDIAEYQTNYWQKNKEELKAYRASWRKANWEKRKTRHQEQYDNDPCYMILHTTRTRVRALIKNSNGVKDCRTLELLGGDLDVVKKHLERLFLPGMTWDNHGVYGWHIDHIKPCASFDLTDPKGLKECFHYTNLQPLWATDNLSKGAKL